MAKAFDGFAVGFTKSWGFQAFIVGNLGQKTEADDISNVPLVSRNKVMTARGKSVVQLSEELGEFLNYRLDRAVIKLISEVGHVVTVRPEVILGLDSPVSPVPLGGVSWVRSCDSAEVVENCVRLRVLDSFFGNKDWDCTSWE